MEVDAIIGKETYDILCYNFKLEEVSSWTKQQYSSVEVRQKKKFNKLVEECEKIGIELPDTNTYHAKQEYAHGLYFVCYKKQKKDRTY